MLQAVESMLEPDEGTTGAMRAITFGVPDITAALDVKEYYCQLAESLQVQQKRHKHVMMGNLLMPDTLQ